MGLDRKRRKRAPRGSDGWDITGLYRVRVRVCVCVCVCACSFFSDNQYPDEAKREEIAAACNSVIQKPGKLRQATYNAIIFREMKQTVACPCACVSSREEAV